MTIFARISCKSWHKHPVIKEALKLLKLRNESILWCIYIYFIYENHVLC